MTVYYFKDQVDIGKTLNILIYFQIWTNKC